METTAKAPVNIVQELIAMHTTRKEAYEKLQHADVVADLKAKLTAGISQSDEFISELMNELSEFGDGVSGEVDRTTEFFTIWKNSMANLENMGKQELSQIYNQLETTLKKNYQQYLDTQVDGTGGLLELLNNQSKALQG